MNDLIHVILDEPQSGARNMAVDEALLEESLRSGTVFLRLYRWSEPTVSLGYFQKEAELCRDPRLANLPSVRRLSGGGAILHHHEQTYSCSLPPSHRLAQQPYQLYFEIHAIFIAWLTECGVPVAPRASNSVRKQEPFLCFQREAAPDLVVHGHKIMGSAQRRRRGAVLQHGSLLLKSSEHTPELLGLCDLIPKIPDTIVASHLIAQRLAQCLGSASVISELPALVRAEARKMAIEIAATDNSVAQNQKVPIVQISTD